MTFTKLGLVAATAAAALFVVGSTGAEAAKKAKTMPTEPVCMFVDMPVCAIKGGKRVTYSNKCFAANDGAWVVSNKACGKGGGKKMAKPAAKKTEKKK
jgi:hypothetical protein